MLLPRHRLDGCAFKSLVAHFYIRHAESSVRDLHPFTTITPLASQKNITSESRDDIMIQFLFRKRANTENTAGRRIRNEKGRTWLRLFQISAKPTFQWTDKLAGLAHKYRPLSRSGENGIFNESIDTNLIEPAYGSLVCPHPSQGVQISFRLEGPYFSEADPSQYRTVICFVAGTGVSGAIAIARAFLERRKQQSNAIADFRELESNSGTNIAPKWERCLVFWSVKAEDYVDLPCLKGRTTFHNFQLSCILTQICLADQTANLQVHVHLTGNGGSRLRIEETLSSICRESPGGSSWVYLSSPNKYIISGEKACKANPGVEWYSAKWDI